MFDQNIIDLVNKDLINYYSTPGKLYEIVNLSKEIKIDLININLKNYCLLIDESHYKKNDKIKNLLYELIEFFLLKEISVRYTDLSSYFLNKINDCKKFNLDDESLFLEIKSKVLNG